MKVLLLIGMLGVTGCSTYVTMEQLEHQAALTGDWSMVEQRERIIARREARKGPKCPTGLVGYCESRVGSMRCQCIGKDSLRDVLSSFR